MSVWVILPVKPLQMAKSRLASVLTPEQRQRFAEGMLRRILNITRTVRHVNGTLVISRDTRVLAIARDHGARTVQESGAPALNPALMRATAMVDTWHASSVLILPADLPLVSAEDISGVIEKAGYAPQAVVLATDRNRDGTNALFVRPPGLIRYDYGTHSFERHAQQARDVGAEVFEYESETLKLDLDVPEDITHFYSLIHGDDLPRHLSLSDAFDTLQAALERGEFG